METISKRSFKLGQHFDNYQGKSVNFVKALLNPFIVKPFRFDQFISNLELIYPARVG